jgi:YgiT-type zinc finger domain-containing protein
LKHCLICRQAQLAPGFATVSLKREDINLSIGSIPANICSSCGEAYLEELVARRLLIIAENSIRMGFTGEPLQFSMID